MSTAAPNYRMQATAAGALTHGKDRLPPPAAAEGGRSMAPEASLSGDLRWGGFW